jgi:hypothetical protein
MRFATVFLMLFMLQMVKAGNGMSVIPVALVENDTITGFWSHFLYSWVISTNAPAFATKNASVQNILRVNKQIFV